MVNGPALPSDKISIDAVDRRPSPTLVIGTLPDAEEVPSSFKEITQAEHAELVKSFNDWRKQYAADQLAKARDRAKLSRAEFKLALLERDELDAVKQAMSSPDADPRAVILWEDALEFRRTNKDLLALASELGYTEEQLDDIFGINS
jgi:hypothetical protein